MIDSGAGTLERSVDPLADALRAMGHAVTAHRLSNRPDSLYIGPRVRMREAEIIYRRPEPGLLLIVLYRRLGERRVTLANPFAELFGFLSLCVEPRFGLRRVLCRISTSPYRDQGGLDDARMVRLCDHLLGAEWVEYDQHPWLAQEAAALRARLERLRPARGTGDRPPNIHQCPGPVRRKHPHTFPGPINTHNNAASRGL
ncbi:hypothetical protein [Allochromatium palmeri]|uniref:Uncharacterized protein n=1 Tax=Allochromatium palmeri TaxID=231048 RepID=A0A6N8EFP5_9GAMM|nr:hypothetical protein [Allochromatium palmeri]